MAKQPTKKFTATVTDIDPANHRATVTVELVTTSQVELWAALAGLSGLDVDELITFSKDGHI